MRDVLYRTSTAHRHHQPTSYSGNITAEEKSYVNSTSPHVLATTAASDRGARAATMHIAGGIGIPSGYTGVPYPFPHRAALCHQSGGYTVKVKYLQSLSCAPNTNTSTVRSTTADSSQSGDPPHKNGWRAGAVITNAELEWDRQ